MGTLHQGKGHSYHSICRNVGTCRLRADRLVLRGYHQRLTFGSGILSHGSISSPAMQVPGISVTNSKISNRKSLLSEFSRFKEFQILRFTRRIALSEVQKQPRLRC